MIHRGKSCAGTGAFPIISMQDNATWGTEMNTDWGIQNRQCYLGYRNEHRLGYSKSTMLLGVQK